jgi:hypothetical protein
MIYDKFEIHNAGSLIEHENGGITWLRVSDNAYAAMSDGGKLQANGSTGVELRFVMLEDEVELKMQCLSEGKSLSTFQIYYGGIQGGWECHEVDKFISKDECIFKIKKPKNMDTLKKMSKDAGLDFSPEVIRIIFNRGKLRILGINGKVRPPKKEELPKKTLLCYGSSITHGSNSYTQPDNWVSVVAHNINYDVMNKGFAGNCKMEPEVVDYLAGLDFDMAVLELGINVRSWPRSQAYIRAKYAINAIAEKGKPVYVISHFYNDEDYKRGGIQSNMWREVLGTICKELSYPNVTYINGLDLLGDMSLISADEIHPNIYGSRQIEQRLTEIIKSGL